MEAATRITYVGHGTVLVAMGDLRVLTDPLLRRWAGPLRRYDEPPDPAVSRDLDAILLSHLHIDHVDTASLRQLDRSAVVLVPVGGGALLRRLGFTDVHEVAAGDEAELGGARVTVVPAEHFVRRHPLARVSDGVGFVVRGPVAVYYAGDTGPFDGMKEAIGKVGVALLPVWGWGHAVDDEVHLTPESGARCAQLLRPAVAVPVHWGTYGAPGAPRSWRRGAERAPQAFAEHARRLAPEVDVRVLLPGESTSVGAQQEAADTQVVDAEATPA